MIDQKLLGAAVQKVRKQAGLTQFDVACATGLTVAYISMLETGARGVSIPALNKIAAALVVPAEMLVFMGSDSKNGDKLHHFVDKTKKAIEVKLL